MFRVAATDTHSLHHRHSQFSPTANVSMLMIVRLPPRSSASCTATASVVMAPQAPQASQRPLFPAARHERQHVSRGERTAADDEAKQLLEIATLLLSFQTHCSPQPPPPPAAACVLTSSAPPPPSAPTSLMPSSGSAALRFRISLSKQKLLVASSESAPPSVRPRQQAPSRCEPASASVVTALAPACRQATLTTLPSSKSPSPSPPASRESDPTTRAVPTTTPPLSTNQLLQSSQALPAIGKAPSYSSMPTWRRPVGQCHFMGCTNKSVSRERCVAHGGGRRCSVDGCARGSQRGNKCRAHSGRERCAIDGCERSAQISGLCKCHSGHKCCRHLDCTKSVHRIGICEAQNSKA